jgi:hypothetical protein
MPLSAGRYSVRPMLPQLGKVMALLEARGARFGKFNDLELRRAMQTTDDNF